MYSKDRRIEGSKRVRSKAVVVGLSLWGGASFAFAGENPVDGSGTNPYYTRYAELKGGWAFSTKRDNIHYKDGLSGAVELGWYLRDEWRVGLEVGLKQHSIKRVDTKWDFENFAEYTDKTPGHAGCTGIGAQGKDYVLHSVMLIGNWTIFNQWYKNYQIAFVQLDRMRVLSGMLNVYYDCPLTDMCNAYIGAGFGMANVSFRVKASVTSTADQTPLTNENLSEIGWFINQNDNDFEPPMNRRNLSKTVFAWQLMTGLGYEFRENWKLSLGYKLFNTADVKVFGSSKIKTPFHHGLEVGLAYMF